MAAAPEIPSFLQSLAYLEGLQTDGWVKMLFIDQLGRLLGDLLDLHAALGTGHQDRPCHGAVKHDAEVQLASDIASCLDKDLIDGFAFRPGLDRNERLSQQPFGRLANLCRRLANDDTPLVGIVLDRPFSAASGMDLTLDDSYLATELIVGGDGFIGRLGDDSLQDRHSGLAKELFALIFVDLHRFCGFADRSRVTTTVNLFGPFRDGDGPYNNGKCEIYA